MTTAIQTNVRLRRPHPHQARVKDSPAPRKVVRAGRRGGKTVGLAIIAVQAFLAERRILYAAPTQEQVDAFWFEVKRALVDPIDARHLYKNETLHIIEKPGTQNRIRAKAAWNSDTLRGDYADLLILDEWQLMDEEAWENVGAPMLLDNDGDAVFIYTPPSLRSRSVSKARDPLHAAKMFRVAEADQTGRWEAFAWKSEDNPHISRAALEVIGQDMTNLAYRQEILAEDVDEVPGALWTYALFQQAPPPDRLNRVVVAIDPAGSAAKRSDETGIVVVGRSGEDLYVLADLSGRLSPDAWARRAVAAYEEHKADRILGETNFGGEMVVHTIRTVAPRIPFKAVHASRGKAVRAEPVAALYEQGKVWHCGTFSALEEQMCVWVPGEGQSPDRVDALVFAATELMVGRLGAPGAIVGERSEQSAARTLGW